MLGGIGVLLSACFGPTTPDVPQISAIPSAVPGTLTQATTLSPDVSVTSSPTGTPITRWRIAAESVEAVHWSEEAAAFIFLPWDSEDWQMVDPSTRSIQPYAGAGPKVDSEILQQFQVLECAPFEVSPQGDRLLYQKQASDTLFEVWYADLGSQETYRVTEIAEDPEAFPWFEQVDWFNNGQEALLNRRRGESLQIFRFDVASNTLVDWFKAFNPQAQQILSQIAPTRVAVLPGSNLAAFVAWSASPERDRLWLADLGDNSIRLIGPACAGSFPFWSADGRYIYYGSGNEPHYYGTFDRDNPIELYKFDVSKGTSTVILPSEVLGTPGIQSWAISADEQYVLYSDYGVSGDDADTEGLWLVKVP
jgi:hypothetical protein